MARTWARQDMDIGILESLYDYKSLCGKTIARLYTAERENHAYERLYALKKRGLVEGVPYYDIDEWNGREKKRKATMYFLTLAGVREVKRIRCLDMDGTERSMRPEDDQLTPLYFRSLVIENTPLELIDAKEFKIKNKIPNFVTLDYTYGEWQIIIERKQSAQYRKKVCQYVKGLAENPACGDFLIICPSESKRMATIKDWMKDYGPNAYFMVRDNFEGMSKLISGDTMAETIQMIEVNKGKVEKLPTAEEGFSHTVNGDRCVVVDLVGFPIRPLRQLKGIITPHHKAHVGVESVDDLKAIARCLPEILKPGFEFFTLDGVAGTSEVVSQLYGRRG